MTLCMYIVTALVYILTAITYLLSYKLYKEPKNDAYFDNVNNYNTINKKDIMASPKYVTTISILLGVFIGMYICLADLSNINLYVKYITIAILIGLYLVEITRKITLNEDNLEFEKFLYPTKSIPLTSIDGMYIYSYNKKFLNRRALTTKLVVSTGREKFKFTLSSIDVKAVINMMKENFGITENKMYIAEKK